MGLRLLTEKDKEELVQYTDRETLSAKNDANVARNFASEAHSKADNAERIAKDKNTVYVFDTPDDMGAWLSVDANRAKLVRGDGIYVKESDFDNRWWDGEDIRPFVDLTGYQRKLSDEQINNINDVPVIKEDVEKKQDKLTNYQMDSINAIEDIYDHLNEEKQDKVTIITTDNDSIIFRTIDMHNKELRATLPLKSLAFEFDLGEYPFDYISSVCFSTGEVPPVVSYLLSGVINWTGVDCATETYTDTDGKEKLVSIFQPSANTHYDVVIYFSTTLKQFVGVVNGFVPASKNRASKNRGG